MLSNFFYLLSGRASGAETSISISRNEICTYPHEMFFPLQRSPAFFLCGSPLLDLIVGHSATLLDGKQNTVVAKKNSVSQLKSHFYVVCTMLCSQAMELTKTLYSNACINVQLCAQLNELRKVTSKFREIRFQEQKIPGQK